MASKVVPYNFVHVHYMSTFGGGLTIYEIKWASHNAYMSYRNLCVTLLSSGLANTPDALFDMSIYKAYFSGPASCGQRVTTLWSQGDWLEKHLKSAQPTDPASLMIECIISMHDTRWDPLVTPTNASWIQKLWKLSILLMIPLCNFETRRNLSVPVLCTEPSQEERLCLWILHGQCH